MMLRRVSVEPTISIDTIRPTLMPYSRWLKPVPLEVNDRVLRIADMATLSRGYEDPPRYRIRHRGDPAVMLGVIMFQVRSFGVMFMVFATSPLGLIGAVPTLLLFNQPFGLVQGREKTKAAEIPHITAG